MRSRQMLVRVERLDALLGGLAKEAAAQQLRCWHAEIEPQRRQYVGAVCRAKEALAEARAALAEAAGRLEGNPLA